MARKERRGPVNPAVQQAFGQGMAHHQAGRLDQAQQLYRHALNLDPDHADSLHYLGILRHQLGDSERALAMIGQALAFDERNAEAHHNIGLVLGSLGRTDEAIGHYRQAVALKPDYADAHTNLAAELLTKGQTGDAVVHFRRALAYKPGVPEHGNLAGALIADGDPAEALGVIARGLEIQETQQFKDLFVDCLKALPSPPRLANLRRLLTRAVTEAWTRPDDLAPIGAALVKQNDAVRASTERASQAWPVRVPARELFGPAGLGALTADALLQILLRSAPLSDIGLERLFANARAALLELAAAASPGETPAGLLDFGCALAQQCFLNEYVYDTPALEAERAGALGEAIAHTLASGGTIAPLALAAVGAYLPLHSLADSKGLLQLSWPEAVTRLLVQQVREPQIELELRAAISAMTGITDPVSARVRQQYEDNPYPRWLRTAAPRSPIAFDGYLRELFPDVAFKALGKSSLDVLIAGCGTGRHPIEVAQRFAGAQVLAIDLSLASLGFARRQAQALAVANLELAQADILELPSIGRSFDVIDATGVLHHMDDPAEGWRRLLGLLRPGGFMHVGLYSALARRDILAARALLAGRATAQSAPDIRRFRQEIMGLTEAAPLRSVVKYPDFFTVSECRDLLFHVHERQWSIPEIKAFVAANDLAFLGFETRALRAYLARHPGDKAMTDLDRWDAFERDNPATFENMYVFWVQKPAA